MGGCVGPKYFSCLELHSWWICSRIFFSFFCNLSQYKKFYENNFTSNFPFSLLKFHEVWSCKHFNGKWRYINIYTLAFDAKVDFLKITKYDSALFSLTKHSRSHVSQSVSLSGYVGRLYWFGSGKWGYLIGRPDILWVNFPSLTFIMQPFSCPSLTALWHLCDGSSESTIYPCEDKSFCPSKDKYQRVSVGMGMRLTKMRWGDKDHLKIFVKNTILALACPTFRCSLPKVIYIFRSGIWDPPFWSRNPEGHNSQPEKQSEVTTSPPLCNNASPHQSARWSSTKHICTAWFHLYLSKLSNIFVHIPK